MFSTHWSSKAGLYLRVPILSWSVLAEECDLSIHPDLLCAHCELRVNCLTWIIGSHRSHLGREWTCKSIPIPGKAGCCNECVAILPVERSYVVQNCINPCIMPGQLILWNTFLHFLSIFAVKIKCTDIGKYQPLWCLHPFPRRPVDTAVERVDYIVWTQPGAGASSRGVMLLCFLLSLVRVSAPRSKLIQPADTDPIWKCVACRCQMQGRDSGHSHCMAGPQISPDDLSHVGRWPLSHLPVTPVRSSCLPPARVTFVVVPWRVLWNQRDDLEFYPLTPVWKVRQQQGCTHMIGLFLAISFFLSFDILTFW